MWRRVLCEQLLNMGLGSFAQCKFANTSLPNASLLNEAKLGQIGELGKLCKLALGKLVFANSHWAKDQKYH